MKTNWMKYENANWVLPSRGALYDFCALDLSPVALERRLTLRSCVLTSANGMMSGSVSGLPSRRFILHASVWTSSFGLMFPHRASFGRECVFSFLRLYLESFSTQVSPTWRDCSPVSVSDVWGQSLECGSPCACNTKLNVLLLHPFVLFKKNMCAQQRCQNYKQYSFVTYCIHNHSDIS